MKTKILTALILLIILVIIVLWKRWTCQTCGCDTKRYEFDVPRPVEPCKCTCKVPDPNPSICHMNPRYWFSGGDADALAVSDPNARDLMTLVLTYVTWGTLADGSHKFLWIESKASPPPGHVTAATGLTLLGLTVGVDFDWMDGTELTTANLNTYTAIGVASSSAGMLTSVELNALQARAMDIQNFTKQGGSIAMFAGLDPNSYSWLPVSLSTSLVSHVSGFSATAIGSNFGLTSATMEYPHSLTFTSYPNTILIPAEKNGGDVTSLMSVNTANSNPCLDRKIDIPDTSYLCT
jgi:hypothetical protein